MIPQTHTVAEVAAALQKSEWWVRKQVKDGRVTPLRDSDAFNAHIRFTQAHIDELYASMQPAPPVERLRRRRRRSA